MVCYGNEFWWRIRGWWFLFIEALFYVLLRAITFHSSAVYHQIVARCASTRSSAWTSLNQPEQRARRSFGCFKALDFNFVIVRWLWLSLLWLFPCFEDVIAQIRLLLRFASCSWATLVYQFRWCTPMMSSWICAFYYSSAPCFVHEILRGGYQPRQPIMP